MADTQIAAKLVLCVHCEQPIERYKYEENVWVHIEGMSMWCDVPRTKAAPPVAMSTPTEPVVGKARTAANPLIVPEALYAHPEYLRGLLRRVSAAYFDREWKQVERLFEAEIEEMEKRRAALPAPQESVQTETRDPYGIEYFVATQPLLETISAMGQEISRLKALAPPVADVPSGDTVLPWLPQPDSEGWWWHQLGSLVQALEVTTLLPAEGDERGVLYVSALGNYADYCGGLWQKVADPK